MKTKKSSNNNFRRKPKEDKLQDRTPQNKKKFGGKFGGQDKKRTNKGKPGKKLSVGSIESRLNSMFDKAISNLGIPDLDENGDAVEKSKEVPQRRPKHSKPRIKHASKSGNRPAGDDMTASLNMLAKDFYEFKHSVNQKLNVIISMLQEDKKK